MWIRVSTLALLADRSKSYFFFVSVGKYLIVIESDSFSSFIVINIHGLMLADERCYVVNNIRKDFLIIRIQAVLRRSTANPYLVSSSGLIRGSSFSKGLSLSRRYLCKLLFNDHSLSSSSHLSLMYSLDSKCSK